MKHIVIRQFGPIDEVDIELKRVNLIIGPQSSGKSTVLKVACYCDWMERQIELTQKPERYCDAETFVFNLINFHRLKGYLKADTYISYENDAVFFDFSEKAKKCTFRWKADKRWKYKRVKIAYIPSERNLVAAIPNWYQVSMKQDNILDFMKEWEFARKAFSKGEAILDLPVKYKYSSNNSADYIVLPNGKELDLTVTSFLVPLFISAFRRADELAIAMECRCYQGGEGRTKMKILRYSKWDYEAYAIGGLLILAVSLLRPFGL